MNLENLSPGDLSIVMEGIAKCACDMMIDEPGNREMIDHYFAVYREYREAYDRRIREDYKMLDLAEKFGLEPLPADPEQQELSSQSNTEGLIGQ